jgi:hypothetical protein
MTQPFLLINRSVVVNGPVESVLVREHNGVEVYRITHDRLLECVVDFAQQKMSWDLEGGRFLNPPVEVGTEFNWSIYFRASIEIGGQTVTYGSSMVDQYDTLEDFDDEEYVDIIGSLTDFYRRLDQSKNLEGTVVNHFSLGLLVDDPHADQTTDVYVMREVQP